MSIGREGLSWGSDTLSERVVSGQPLHFSPRASERTASVPADELVPAIEQQSPRTQPSTETVLFPAKAIALGFKAELSQAVVRAMAKSK